MKNKNFIILVLTIILFTFLSCEIIEPIINKGKPETPINISIVSISENEIMLKWDDVCDFEDGFLIYKTNSSGDYEIFANLPSNTEEWINSTIEPKDAPYYRIRTYIANDTSEVSNAIKARFQHFEFVKTNHFGQLNDCKFNFSNDLIAASEGKSIHIFNASSLEHIRTISSFSKVTTFSFSRTQNWLTYGTENGVQIIYDVSTFSELNKFNFGIKINATSFNCDNSNVVVGAKNIIFVYDFNTNTMLKQFNAHDNDIKDIKISYDCEILASSSNKEIKIWDSNTLNLIKTVSIDTGFGPATNNLEFNNDNSLLVISNGNTMENHSSIFYTSDFSLAENRFHQSTHSQFSENGKLLLACVPDDKNPTIQFYNVNDLLTIPRTFFEDRVFTENISGLDISNNDENFITCGKDGLLLWNLYPEKRWVVVH